MQFDVDRVVDPALVIARDRACPDLFAVDEQVRIHPCPAGNCLDCESARDRDGPGGLRDPAAHGPLVDLLAVTTSATRGRMMRTRPSSSQRHYAVLLHLPRQHVDWT